MRKNLIKWEVDNGYKAKYVAEKLGIAHSTWSNIKSGRSNPTFDLLEKFQEAFQTQDIISLFAEDDE